MNRIFDCLLEDREYRNLEEALLETCRANISLPILVSGLPYGGMRVMAASLIRKGMIEKRPVLCLCADEKEASDLANFFAYVGLPAVYYPKRDFITYPVTASHEFERERLSVLLQLAQEKPTVVCATPDACSQYVMPIDILKNSCFHIKQDDNFVVSELVKRLLDIGFVRVETVEGMGQFALRGGILDVFSPSEPNPVRIDFFGDTVDSMHYFDKLTQRTSMPCLDLSILPAKEVLPTEESLQKMRRVIEKLLEKVPREASKETLQKELFSIDNHLDLAFCDKYITLHYSEKTTLFSYLSWEKKALSVVLNTPKVEECLKNFDLTSRNEITTLLEDGILESRYAGTAIGSVDFKKCLQNMAVVHLNAFADTLDGQRLGGLFSFKCRKTPVYGCNLPLMVEDIRHYVETKVTTYVCTDNDKEAETVYNHFKEEKIDCVLVGKSEIPKEKKEGRVYILECPLEEGFDLFHAKIAILTTSTHTIKKPKLKESRRLLKKVGAGERILSYAELTPGDYVVHDMNGIGMFEKLQSMCMGGVRRDYITILYADGNRMHIPADKLDGISKYIGARAEDGTVRLSKIGGTEWFKTKQKAKNAVKDIAKDLIQLYAERTRRPGIAFPEDCDMENEFGDMFEFTETEPQEIAIRDIKEDMMRPYPMDRLLCGDVGFGKTEVAFRAAFKAVLAGYQVAILVPTTILALQHYETALARFRGFPVKIEMISSFRTKSNQEMVKRALARGEVDIIIGTHALLASSVDFKKLGLLIVDEEQRFGVAQKEKIKQKTANIDVLTLSATPIPRTLNMAMSGVRDMSVLDVAPEERHPVQTYVMEYDEVIIMEAIRKELRRNGQVLYLYNRVENIDLKAAHIQEELPEHHVVYAHGQMEKDELEKIWKALVRGEIDVLVCTTIVESGVDLPNANTLIIEDADKMGLSQLHQIRGRVGRSGRYAHAYFTYRPGKALTDIATKRLSAIRDYAEFGAGFRIALRDLEIRGAGNLLGAEQHGHIDAVGYDMYIRLLNEAILEEKGEIIEKPFECKMNLELDALIPTTYIESLSQRMDMYKKISLIQSDEDRHDVENEFEDRFGKMPIEAKRLLYVAEGKALASKARFTQVEYKSKALNFSCESLDISAWSKVIYRYKGMTFRGSMASRCITYPVRGGVEPSEEMIKILKSYLEFQEEKEKK